MYHKNVLSWHELAFFDMGASLLFINFHATHLKIHAFDKCGSHAKYCAFVNSVPVIFFYQTWLLIVSHGFSFFVFIIEQECLTDLHVH